MQTVHRTTTTRRSSSSATARVVGTLPQGAPARATRSTSPGVRSNTSNGATSNPGPTASWCGRRSAAPSVWRSATTGAGPRPTACWGSRASSSSSSATTRRSTTRRIPSQDRLAGFHNHLVMQAGAYQNGTWVVGVGQGWRGGGRRRRWRSRRSSRPSGEIVARCTTVGDELAVADCDLDRCANVQADAVRLRSLPDARSTTD